MKKMILAGIASVALAGALAAMPAVVSAKAFVSQLSTSERAIATQLAESIVVAVMKAQSETTALSSDQAKVHIQLTVQHVIRNSGATPIVAAAALEMAQARLAENGTLTCINPKDDEQNCTPASLALASLSALLQSIVETAPAAANGPAGAIPLGSPVALTPPNSGSSDYRGS